MQAPGQYAVPDVPQYVVGRVPPPPPHGHIFNLSHEMSPSPSSGHNHSQSHIAHSQHQAYQQSRPHLSQQLEHGQQQHPQLLQHQLAQSQQATAQPQQHAYGHQSQQQQQLQHLQTHPQQQHQHVQPSQQQQQLGRGSETPPEAPSPRPLLNINNFSKGMVSGRDESLLAEEQDPLGEDGERGLAGNRWPRQETLSLLKIRSDMDATFRDSSLKGPLWEEVSRRLADMGYHRSAKKCKEKFENVHKYYKRTKCSKAGRQDGKSYRFFTQLEALYGKAVGDDNLSNKTSTGLLSSSIIGATGGNFGTRTGVAPKSRSPLSMTGIARTSQTEDPSGPALKSDSDMSNSLNSSSESSDDEFEHADDREMPDSKKRKRTSVKKYLIFFESVMKKILDKQEQMQRKFLEALERRDHDRIIREEAWKRQEMARLSREHDLRAQERALSASRDAALVAFLQKVTGQTLQFPQIGVQAQPTSMAVPLDLHEDFQHGKEFYDSSSKRWPKPEVLALIKLRMGLDQKFHEPGSKSLLWEQVSAGMACQGFSRTAKRCKEKWENINKYFKKAKESSKKRPDNAKTCPYFHQLDALYKEGILGTAHNMQLLLELKSEKHTEVLMLEQPNGSNTREDFGQAQEGDSEVLAIRATGENDPATTTTTHEAAAAHFLMHTENDVQGNANVNKKRSKENQLMESDLSITPPSTTASASPLNSADRVTSFKVFSGSSKQVHSEPVQEDLQFGP